MGEKFEVLKAEFKKIIWPSRQQVTKETIAVVCFGLGLGVLIGVLDMVIKFGLGFIL